jgi:hypothetical protein
MRKFAAHGVLQTADRVLHLAFDLIGLAFAFHLLVSQGLAGPFLHLALGLLGGALDAIFVNHFSSPEIDWFGDGKLARRRRSSISQPQQPEPGPACLLT